MEKITTHVLDTTEGIPASGVRVRLFLEHSQLVVDTITNADGRCNSPLIVNPPEGAYRLLFSVGDYFRSRGQESPFLDIVQLDFQIQPNQSYHIPLLCSPYSYSTYRGS